MSDEIKNDATTTPAREQKTASMPPLQRERESTRPTGLTTGVPPSTPLSDRTEDETKWPRGAKAPTTDRSNQEAGVSGIGSENKAERGDQRPGGERDSQRKHSSTTTGSHSDNAASSRMQSEGAPLPHVEGASAQGHQQKSGCDSSSATAKAQVPTTEVEPPSTPHGSSKTHEFQNPPTKGGTSGR